VGTGFEVSSGNLRSSAARFLDSPKINGEIWQTGHSARRRKRGCADSYCYDTSSESLTFLGIRWNARIAAKILNGSDLFASSGDSMPTGLLERWKKGDGYLEWAVGLFSIILAPIVFGLAWPT
jgi:hypothetical protein